MAGDGNSPFEHERLWAAIDAVAAINGLSPSALARLAGLNATSFNKSKRRGADGRLRWPSTESIAKVLDATGFRLDAFLGLLAGVGVERLQPSSSIIPLVDASRVDQAGFFEPGSDHGRSAWDSVPFPSPTDLTVFAVEVADHGMQPLYRKGDTLIVSRSAELRRGDRALLLPAGGAVCVRVFCRKTTRNIEVYDPATPDRTTHYATDEIRWLARILWASQ